MGVNDIFIRRGKEKWRFAATLTDTGNPWSATLAEINGATVLADVVDVTGFTLENSLVTSAPIDTTFDVTTGGVDTASDCALTFLDRDQNRSANAAKTALAKGATGFILRFPFGIVAGRDYEIWPVESTGPNIAGDPGEHSRWMVKFGIRLVPTLDAVVPAV